jgi:hypothetical protein
VQLREDYSSEQLREDYSSEQLREVHSSEQLREKLSGEQLRVPIYLPPTWTAYRTGSVPLGQRDKGPCGTRIAPGE